MKEPYATIWTSDYLAEFFQGDEPDFSGLDADARAVGFSSGEIVLLEFCRAFCNVFDRRFVDDATKDRVLLALNRWACRVDGCA